jgi:thiopurine S-methyltransferase
LALSQNRGENTSGGIVDNDFWHQKWESNQLGFHERKTNPLLLKFFHDLSLRGRGRVFLPLCGKTLDIAWLLSNDYQVVGSELSEKAVDRLFFDLKLDPRISRVGRTKLFQADNIDLYVGDIFDLSKDELGVVDAVYDRAALVALPKPMRDRYSRHLMEITDEAPQLLICYEYDQALMEGPPFSIERDEVFEHYENRYQIALLSSTAVLGNLKGQCAASESVWLLQNP